MELGVFQYRRDGNKVRIDDVMRIGGGPGLFPGGAVVPLPGKMTEFRARREATGFLRTTLPKLTGAYEGAALLVSEASARLLDGWTRAGMAMLLDIGMSRVGRRLDLQTIKAGPSQGVPLPWIYPDDVSINGFMAPDGTITVLKCRWPGLVDNRSWVLVPAALGLEWRGQAPAAMVQDLADLAQIGMSDVDLWAAANRMFWKTVVPAMEDPFLRQQRCWIGTSIGIEDFMTGHAQPAAMLTYRVGDERMLVRLIVQVLGLTGSVQPMLQNVLDVFGAIELRFRAAGGSEPARFLRIDVGELPEASVRLIDRLLSIIAPSGEELVGALRLSGARRVPAEVTCLLTRQNLVVPSAHERIAHTQQVADFLLAHQVSVEEASALMDAL